MGRALRVRPFGTCDSHVITGGFIMLSQLQPVEGTDGALVSGANLCPGCSLWCSPFFPPSCSHGPDLRSCLQISCKEAKMYEGFFGKEAKVLIHVMKMSLGPGPPRLPSRVGLHFSPLKCHITACPSHLLWDLQSHCSCGAALVAVGLNCSCIHSDPPPPQLLFFSVLPDTDFINTQFSF